MKKLIILALLAIVSSCATIPVLNGCGRIVTVGDADYEVHFKATHLDGTYSYSSFVTFRTLRPDTLMIGDVVCLSRMGGR